MIGHLKNADLIRRAKPVFRGPQDAVGHLLLSFEIQHTVHHVLQYFWPCDGALFVHMSNDKNGHTTPLCQLHQGHGTLLDLSDAPRRGGEIPIVEGLDGVDDQNIRI